jgi:hypothetical protein
MLEPQGYQPVRIPDYLTPELTAIEPPFDPSRKAEVLYFDGRGNAESRALAATLEAGGQAFFGLGVGGLKQLFQAHRHFIYPTRQPGMDKTPREAAANGCVVWCLASGAAEHEEDVPLPARYRSATIGDLRAGLVESLGSDAVYAADHAAQQEYRDWVRSAQGRFQDGAGNFLKAVELC